MLLAGSPGEWGANHKKTVNICSRNLPANGSGVPADPLKKSTGVLRGS